MKGPKLRTQFPKQSFPYRYSLKFPTLMSNPIGIINTVNLIVFTFQGGREGGGVGQGYRGGILLTWKKENCKEVKVRTRFPWDSQSKLSICMFSLWFDCLLDFAWNHGRLYFHKYNLYCSFCEECKQSLDCKWEDTLVHLSCYIPCLLCVDCWRLCFKEKVSV